MLISVVVPTVTGREEYLERCIRAYEERTIAPIELIVIMNAPTCGVAWNEGAGRANGDYLHWTADDLEPFDGWDEPARQTVYHDGIPAPVTYRPDGALESSGGYWDRQHADHEGTDNTAVVPFCSLEQWDRIGPHLDCHYYTDNWFTHRAWRAGYPVVVRTRYAFTHWWAQAGRGAGMSEEERMAHDRAIFERAVAEEDR